MATLKEMLDLHSKNMQQDFFHQMHPLREDWEDVLQQKLGESILHQIKTEAEPLTKQDAKNLICGDEPEQMAVLGRRECRLLYSFFGDIFNGYHEEIWVR
jgi:hypothetical protein